MSYKEDRLAMSKKVIEALKKLGEVSDISQKEMQKQAMESIVKKKPGKYRLAYKKKTKTIIAEPRIWEWEPKPKDICFDKAGHELIVIGINSRKPWVIEVAEVHEDGINMDSETICPDEVVPFIPWQKIENILEENGCWLEISKPLNRYLRKGEMKVRCSIYIEPQLLKEGTKDNLVGYARDASRQMATTKALLELRKESKCQ